MFIKQRFITKFLRVLVLPAMLCVPGVFAQDQIVNGNLGVGVPNPQRAVHLSGEDAVFRMDRDRDTAAFLLVRTAVGDFDLVQKTFVVGANSSGVNNGEFIINDLGTAVAGDGIRRWTIGNEGNFGFNKRNPTNLLDVANNAGDQVMQLDSDGNLWVSGLIEDGIGTIQMLVDGAISNATAIQMVVDDGTASTTAITANRAATDAASNALDTATGVVADDLNTASNALGTAIGAVAGDLNTASNALNTAITGNGSSITANRAATDTVSNALNTAIGVVAGDLNTASNALNAAITVNGSAITANRAATDAASNGLDTAIGVVADDLNTASNALNAAIGVNGSAISANRAATDAASNALDTAISGNSSAISANRAATDAASNALDTAIGVVAGDLNTASNALRGDLDAHLVADTDLDPANEIQELSVAGQDLTLSLGGGTVTLPGGSDTDWVDDGTNVTRTSGRAIAPTFLGGTGNSISNNVLYGFIGGGQGNEIGSGDDWSVIAGGLDNTNGNDYATVGGGRQNSAAGLYTTVAGGWMNLAIDNYSTIGGGRNNTVPNGDYGTISGGQNNNVYQPWASIGGGGGNVASNWYSTIGGGDRNKVSGDSSTVAGGWTNHADSIGATVGGGRGNGAEGSYSCIPGGRNNRAANQYSFAHGRFAHALHDGAWVWADSVNIMLTSSANNQMTARASGGYRFFSNSGSTLGAELPANATAWSALSDRNSKENIQDIDPQEILETLAGLPLSEWNYSSDPTDRRYIGPMAQDFHASFGLGDDNKRLNTMDLDGVALAAIQGLYEVVQERDDQIEDLQLQMKQMQDEIRALSGTVK